MVVKGANSYTGKERRKMRRENHIARDLRSGPKYRLRRVESKKDRGEKYPISYNEENDSYE